MRAAGRRRQPRSTGGGASGVDDLALRPEHQEGEGVFARPAAARAGAREPDADVVDDRVVRSAATPPARHPTPPGRRHRAIPIGSSTRAAGRRSSRPASGRSPRPAPPTTGSRERGRPDGPAPQRRPERVHRVGGRLGVVARPGERAGLDVADAERLADLPSTASNSAGSTSGRPGGGARSAAGTGRSSRCRRRRRRGRPAQPTISSSVSPMPTMSPTWW